jgi:hypothetical protein
MFSNSVYNKISLMKHVTCRLKSTNFLKLKEPPKNNSRRKSDMEQHLYWRPVYINPLPANDNYSRSSAQCYQMADVI